MALWRLLLILTIGPISMAQPINGNLSQDPVFTTVLNRRLKYPREAEWSGVYARVFAGFTVDEKGRIQDISILNQSSRGTHFGFEPTIITALKKVPSLNLRYTGSYILPISFIYVDYRHKDTPFIPKDSLFIDDLRGRVVLTEIKVFGSSVNSRERVRSAVRNEPY